MKSIERQFLLAVLVSLATLAHSDPAIPRTLNYQGNLTTAAGQPVPLAAQVRHGVRLPIRRCQSQINGRTAKDPGSSSARATAQHRSLGVHQALNGGVPDTGELMFGLFMLAAPCRSLISDPDRAMMPCWGPQTALRLVKDCLQTPLLATASSRTPGTSNRPRAAAPESPPRAGGFRPG
jgi:hypothetical protein